MNLVIPTIGVEPGPTWASDLNASLSIVDSHNHSAGSGVAITPDGLNISTDLPINGNNLTLIRSARYQAQGSPLALVSDIGCCYVSGVDLYYNDVNGNQIQITASGGVAGSPGNIGSLTPPASATYVSLSETFVWQSAVNKPANMDFGYAILRNNSVSSFGLSLFPPTAMGADFSIILPSLPVTTKIMTIDSAGNMGAVTDVDNVTLQISSNIISVKNLGIDTAQLAAGAVTKPKLAALGQQVSASCSGFTTSSTSFVDVTNLSVTITTTGRPVMLMLMADGNGTLPSIASATFSGAGKNTKLRFSEGGTELAQWQFNQIDSNTTINLPVYLAYMLVGASAASHTYKVQGLIGPVGSNTLSLTNLVFAAYEL